jgi:beta-phosphoglucomutase-like phosphatase (HAD superfamily)
VRALLFDCDGVLVDTERDGHRVAFNRAFAEKGLGIVWGVTEYGPLLEIAGGKERMRRYFEAHGWPVAEPARDGLIAELHRLKTDLFMEIVGAGRLPLRPGVARLVGEAKAAGLTLAVCSTSNERAVSLIVEKLLAGGGPSPVGLVLAGDVVARKKPDPEIYRLACTRLGIPATECVVIEDSRNGLLAAKAAGMRCVITTNDYTVGEDFAEADGVFPELGDPPHPHVTLAYLKGLA